MAFCPAQNNKTGCGQTCSMDSPGSPIYFVIDMWNNSKDKQKSFLLSDTKYQDIYNQMISSFDPTAGWKTYTNDDWGIEFKYPNDWAVNQEEVPWNVMQDGLVLISRLKPLNKKYYYEGAEIYPISVLVYNKLLNKYIADRPGVKQNVTINGYSFVEVKVSSTYYEHSFYVDISNKDWEGFLIFSGGTKDPYLESSLNNIISTFKFIP